MSSNATGVIIGLALGWFSLALGLLLHRALRGWWRARRYGPPVDHSVLLVEYGRKMTKALDRHALGELLVLELPRVLQVDRAALLLSEGHQLVSVDADADAARPVSAVRLPVSHAAVRWVASGGEAQTADRGRLREVIEQGRGDLIWTQVWVPLMRGAELRGMWLLGPRQDERQYSPQDLRWLTTLGRQATAVLEATRHAEQERRVASEIRALYRQAVTARETERGRMARDLHDGVLQDLCAVTRDLKALQVRTTSDEALYTDLPTRSGQTIHALRAICNDLRPPLLQHDLTSALKALVAELDARSTAPIHIDVTAGEGDRIRHLSDDEALAFYRITQEALHNAIQHADASEIAVRLTQYPDRLRLTVTDDGRGIVGGTEPGRFVDQGHFGLAGMRERAAMIDARLDVQTAVDYGTVVILDLSH